MIPDNLFSNTKNLQCLAKTFAGIYFDNEQLRFTFLNALQNNPALDIRGIFSMCKYANRENTITGIFNGLKLSNISGAFCTRRVTLKNIGSSTGAIQVNISTQYIPLENNYGNKFVNNFSSIVTNPISNNIHYLYCGIEKGANGVTENGWDSILNQNSNTGTYDVNS